MRGSARLALCVALAALVGAPAPARADSGPIFFYHPERVTEGAPKPPPTGALDGPCGLTVDAAGRFYVSDYYHRTVDLFSPAPEYLSQPLAASGTLDHLGPLDDPCGLAIDGSGTLYVDDYHREVVRFPAPTALGTATTIDSGDPTGVAVDPASGRVYVDDRTYVAVYEPSGAPVEVGGEPLRIGEGSLGDGYGVAVSAVGATAGRVYVPDAASGTVKVYDPTVDPESPVQTIDGGETPAGHFVSLRDTAIAVDNSVSGRPGYVYLADNLEPEYAERPAAAIYGFAPSGAYAGRLEQEVIDALPPGLAVDGSAGGEAGRVYVTSGNTEEAGVYAYAPGSLVMGAGGPVGGALAAAGDHGALAAVAGAAGGAGGAADPSAAASEVAQKGRVRVKVDGRLAPTRLPRRGEAPISVFFSGRISTADGSALPQLTTLRIELNRHGRLDLRGLPPCPLSRIQPASTARALAACRASLVGSGSFWANIVLAGQAPYPTRGRLLVFAGRRHGRPALLGQIYAARPFATSFVIPFAIHRIARGEYGTALTASLPSALGSWGYVTAIEMKLGRRFSFRGSPRSLISAGCPAPQGFPGALFPLARTSFGFADGTQLSSTLTRSCGVRR